MPQPNKTSAALEVPPLRLSRVFHARRETVFRAWSTAEHVKRWFAPEGYTVPVICIEMRPGGPFKLTMRAPGGLEHRIAGTFAEVIPQTRLVIDMHVADAAGKPQFRAYTEIEFADALGGTEMKVTQTYTLADPEFAWMVQGAPQGWASTLDNLEREVIRMQGGGDTGTRSAVHDTFQLKRRYDAPATRVWKAFTDIDAKQKWFGPPPERCQILERRMDVRVGGTEVLQGRWESGLVSTFEATYHDVVPGERLVYSYVMHLDDKKISVSLATIELRAEDGKTALTVTEQGAFLDGYDDAGSREQGTAHLLDQLGKSLEG